MDPLGILYVSVASGDVKRICEVSGHSWRMPCIYPRWRSWFPVLRPKGCSAVVAPRLSQQKPLKGNMGLRIKPSKGALGAVKDYEERGSDTD